MKKIMFLAVLLMGVFGSTVLASNDEGISREAKKAFHKQFPDAEFVTWSKVKNQEMYMVKFVQDKETQIAYFLEEGDLAVVVRNASTDDMPRSVEKAVKKRYGSSQIRSIEEMTIDDESSYLFTIDKENTRRYVRIFNDGEVSEIKKETLTTNKNHQ